MTESLVGVLIKKGYSVELTCTVANHASKPTVRWAVFRYNNVVYVNGSDPVNTNSSVWTSTLNIKYFNYSHAGKYICEAFNSVQHQKRAVNLSIEGTKL